MEVLGVCAVCSAPAGRTCIICGRNFCDLHIGAAGVCVWCAAGKRGTSGKQQPAGRRKDVLK
ncbi:MAG: hypothetical protein CVT47_03175 [Thermoplasmata archaeon HGW-Thermoplasmata-2]|nr:MAG: hypothetical protein CVT47_03175 [Thermoplasmata archaeon HGW-Thermoplasmata-2]